MNLSDKLICHHHVAPNRLRIMAIDDSFVDKRQQGESIYKSADIDRESICAVCRELYSMQREPISK